MLVRSGVRPLQDTQNIPEVLRFLERLEGRIHTLSELSLSIKQRTSRTYRGAPPGLSEYTQCRDYALECWSFAVVIERRLHACDHPAATEMTDRFHLLVVTIWSVLLDTSLKFLTMISRTKDLPLGSHNLFTSEVQRLHKAYRFLSAPPYVDMIDRRMKARTERVAHILKEIIARAPALLEFADDNREPTEAYDRLPRHVGGQRHSLIVRGVPHTH